MIYNLTQFEATENQKEDGIVDVDNAEYIKEMLTFIEFPTPDIMFKKATNIANYAKNLGASEVLIGGPQYFMPYLTRALKSNNIKCYYSYAPKIEFYKVNADGSKKHEVSFEYLGMVEAT